MELDRDDIVVALRAAGARFAFVFGSRARGEGRPDSDLDVAAWWGATPPSSWDLALPSGVDLLVLDGAPLWLAGRVALEGEVLFEDDAAARVAWQADTRAMWLDERPLVLESQRTWRQAVIDGR